MQPQTPAEIPELADQNSISTSEYASRRSALMRLINQVRSAGAQLDVDLPRIAVIGNQSAGKSSLVEAISEIKVPRDTGTCTRCPFEVRLQHSDAAWRAQVKIRREYDEDGAKLNEVVEICFGPPLNDPDNVDDLLRRAQLAVLNPRQPAASFVSYDLGELRNGRFNEHQLSFSRNLVCIDISGRNVTDLTFVDLPGIISNGDEREIELVKGLVRHYIKGNCLILLTVTMRDDIENQSAASLARQADPEGKRTIGVLTKPDTLQAGEQANWLKTIRGEKDHLLHGYYVTKQPAPTQLKDKISFADARKDEAAFFQGPIWGGLSREIAQRLGTKKLMAALSDLLSDFIAKLLPGLVQSIADSHAHVTERITQLPPPPTDDPCSELLLLCNRLVNEVTANVQGAQNHEELWHECTAVFKTLHTAIAASIPIFVPEENRPRPKVAASKSKASGISVAVGTAPSDGRGNPRVYLSEIRAHVRKAITRELPLNLPFQAKASLITQYSKQWPKLTLQAFEDITPLVRASVEGSVHRYFGRYEQGMLKGHVLRIVSEHLERVGGECKAFLARLARLESTPITFNEHYFMSVRDKRLSEYKEARAAAIADKDEAGDEAEPAANGDSMAELFSQLALHGYKGLKEEDLARLLPPDEWEQELIVCAEVSAYLRVAYKRVIDYAPAAIDHEYLQPIVTGLQDALVRNLNISDRRACGVYLQESPDIAHERAELASKLDRLNSARQAFRNFDAPQPGHASA